MRRFAFVFLLISCGDGARGGAVASTGELPRASDGVDPQNGNDLGDGREGATGEVVGTSTSTCTRSTDCAHGSCLRFGKDSDPGLCMAICSLPTSGSIPGDIRVEGCLGVEQCVVFTGGAGLCLAACRSSADCRTGTVCQPAFDTASSGLFCLPTGDTREEVEVEPTPSIDAGTF